VPKKTKPKTKAERRILESALLLFSRHGFGGTALRDVARHAHVTPVTLYRGFKNKHDLIRETLELVIKRHFDPSQFLMIVYEHSARKELGDLLLPALLRWYASLPVPGTKLLMNAYLSDSAEWRGMAAEAIKKLMKVLTAFIDRELQTRPSSNILAQTATRTLLMVLFHMKITSLETKSAREEKKETAEVEAILRYCLIGLRDG